MKMNKFLLIIIATSFFSAKSVAQKIPLPGFLKWHTNNSPGCKNVILTKDSMILPVKNKCQSENELVNWRPGVDISDGLKFAIPANAKIQLIITYKFLPIGNDVLSFYGSYDPVSDNSDESSSRFFQLPVGENRILPASKGYNKAVILINFSNESINPVWKSAKALNGDMNFSFTVTTNGGETHQGSKAIIKEVKLEVIKL